jgi:hypothetical protein
LERVYCLVTSSTAWPDISACPWNKVISTIGPVPRLWRTRVNNLICTWVQAAALTHFLPKLALPVLPWAQPCLCFPFSRAPGTIGLKIIQDLCLCGLLCLHSATHSWDVSFWWVGPGAPVLCVHLPGSWNLFHWVESRLSLEFPLYLRMT